MMERSVACSKYEYTKLFEQHSTLLRNTWLVVRIDGHGFHRFSKQHGFHKPNDIRALQLMNTSARQVMLEFNDIALSYGQSDEFSFVFLPSTQLYKRREAKIISNLCSFFTAAYVMNWASLFDQPLQYPPAFDARAVCFPSTQNLRDYLSWRQVDCHINNLVSLCLLFQTPFLLKKTPQISIILPSGL